MSMICMEPLPIRRKNYRKICLRQCFPPARIRLTCERKIWSNFSRFHQSENNFKYFFSFSSKRFRFSKMFLFFVWFRQSLLITCMYKLGHSSWTKLNIPRLFRFSRVNVHIHVYMNNANTQYIHTYVMTEAIRMRQGCVIKDDFFDFFAKRK